MAEAPDTTLTLEARLARLEAIADSLERDDLELDAALALFEEGIAHLREARRTIEAAELRIARLLEDGEGGAVFEPMGRDPD